MAKKKSFTKGINAIFSDIDESDSSAEPSKRGRQQEAALEASVGTAVLPSVEEETEVRATDTRGFQVSPKDKSEARTTVVLDSEVMDRAKAIAFWERKQLKMLLAEAVELLFEQREASRGGDYVDVALSTYRSRGD